MEKPCQIIFLILILIFVKLSKRHLLLMIIYIQYLTLQKKKNLQRYNKIKRSKLPIICSVNTSATFNLILSGDIEINPGPGFSVPKCTEKLLKLIINS